MTEPSFVGPPPAPPLEPRRRPDLAGMHVILILVTVGLWIPVWILMGLDTARFNRYEQKRYDDEMARYRVEYDAWQRRYSEVFGHAPGAPSH